MPITFDQLVTREQIRIGDSQGQIWDKFTVAATMIEAINSSWPFFFEYLEDTTYTGSGSVAAYTESVAIPTAFLPDATTGRGAGMIFSVWGRVNDGTVSPQPTILPPWFKMEQGCWPDPLIQASPKFHLDTQDYNVSELKFCGGRPMVGPLLSAITVIAAAGTYTVNPSAAVPVTAGDKLLFGPKGGMPAELDPNTTYYALDTGSGSTRVAATVGGSQIVMAGGQTGFMIDLTKSIAGSDTLGWDLYVLARCEELLHSQKQRSGANDAGGHSQKRLLAQQEAQKMMTTYSMPRFYETLWDVQ